METLFVLIKKVVPRSVFTRLQPLYHRALVYIGAILYRRPSRELYVIGVTGTKGKSSVAEILHAILTAAGHKTAVLSTIHFKIGVETEPNLFKMTMPGRFFVQKFLRRAVKANCTHVVIEITSEAVTQFRHLHIDLDALVFTNLSPEHIDSHGSFENYKNAKLQIRDRLQHSCKKNKAIVSNIDDEHGEDFLKVKEATHIPYSQNEVDLIQEYPGIEFEYKNTLFRSYLQGNFNVSNILASIKLAEHIGVPFSDIQKGLRTLLSIPGRVEYIDAGQSFPVVIDYAHTPDSLEKFYQSFPHSYKICVLGNTGGGRDHWKRPKMAAIAEKYCKKIILTNEDPYDEDPKKIINEMAAGMNRRKPKIIIDRTEAIKTALANVPPRGIVLITGKGTDPYIMGADGAKIKWSDKEVTLQELNKIKLN